MNTKKFLLGLSLLISGAMCSPVSAIDNIVQTTVVNTPVHVNVYTGTITNGSQTALYIYVPTYLGRDTADWEPENTQVIYAAVYRAVAPEYQAIMPDSAYLSTAMNGFIIIGAPNFETLDAEEGAQAFADILAAGDWSDIANAAAYFFPGSVPAGTPQNAVSTTSFSFLRGSDSWTNFVYIDGVLTSVTNQTIYYAVPTITVNNQSLNVTQETSTENINASQSKTLRAWVENGILYVSGLAAGETWNVYNTAGMLIYQNVAGGAVGANNYLPLQSHGVYFIKQGNNAVKAVW